MPRFSIRDLLWLMVVVALCCGYVWERTRHVADMKATIVVCDENERLAKESTWLRNKMDALQKTVDFLMSELRKTDKYRID
ncbi:MAG TPA: hypothetical protein VGI40_25735 [Pirellulaceae bacterium]|jgi:hypothetical protein